MDVGKQAEVHNTLTGGGIETPNEARLVFNLPPLEGGDTVYMQQQDFPLDQVRQNRIVSPTEPVPVAEDPEDDQPSADDELRSVQQSNFILMALRAARAEVFRND
ncbi:hypothetical protein NMB32_14610 [Stenotrophomonas sp. CD2]|nr:hypothetical protein NMB32_14610 [Stenotrophomonas sp. CD2]